MNKMKNLIKLKSFALRNKHHRLKISCSILYSNTKTTTSFCSTILKKINENNESVTNITASPIKNNKCSSKKVVSKSINKEDISFCESLYKQQKPDDRNLNPIQKLHQVTDCSFWKFGVNISYTKIKYGYCKTCDKNLVNTICETCLLKCHKGHCIKSMLERGNIKCSCGENNHIIKDINNDVNINCLCNEWSFVSKLNYYYKNNDKNLCIFCHTVCNNNSDKDKIVFFKKDDNNNNDDNKIPMCNCDNEEVHFDVKIFTKHITNFFSLSNQMKQKLHPTQLINMIFKSTNNFDYIFFQLKEFINMSHSQSYSRSYFENFFLMDITCTSVYFSLKLITTLINKTHLAYYCDNVEKYFSFEIYKSILSSMKKSNVDERSYWIFCRDYMYILYKIYINKCTRHLLKLTFYDLENLSYIQRLNLFNRSHGEKEFPESKKITVFLLSQIRTIDVYQYNSIESIECIKNILLIFFKFASFNLLSIEDMINICIKIEVIFNYINLIRQASFKKNIDQLIKLELKMLNIIIKMMLIFIYNYNDRIITNILFNKEKFYNVNDVTNDKVNFLIKNSKLGNFINKIAIRITSILIKYYKERQNTLIYKQTLLNIIRILQFSLTSDDNYMKNIIQSLEYLKYNDCSYLFNEKNNSEIIKYYYEVLQKESDKIEKTYFNYLNFIICKKDLLNIMHESLNIILERPIDQFDEKNIDNIKISFSNERNIAIIQTHYFDKICKIFDIIFNENEKNIDQIVKKSDGVVKKILIFYFIFVNTSSDNAILILSNYLLKEIVNLPVNYNLYVFKLIYKCFNSISTSFKQIINIKSILDIIYTFLGKNLVKKDKIVLQNGYDCLLYFLNIIKIIIYDMRIYLTDDSLLSFIKNIIYDINREYEISKNYFQNEEKHPLFHISLTRSEKIKKDEEKRNIKVIFLIIMKIINDIFDFNLENEREMINNIINIDDIIFALLNFSLKLNERTEFIRFIRKMLVDISYCEKKEEFYTSFIINKRDNLADIFTNDLISNFRYPTKLLSFKKNFYSLSKLVVLREKLRKKILHKKSDRNTFQVSESESEEISLGEKLTNRVHEKKIVLNNKLVRVCPLNEETNFTKMCIKCGYYLGVQNNYTFFRNKTVKRIDSVNSSSKRKSIRKGTMLFNNINNTNNINNNLDDSNTCIAKRQIRNKSVKVLNTTISLYGKKINNLYNLNNKDEKLKNIDKIQEMPAYLEEKSTINEKLSSIMPLYNLSINPRLIRKSIVKFNNELIKLRSDSSRKQSVKNSGKKTNKVNIDSTTEQQKNSDSILVKDKDIYYYSVFDYDFYRILKYELENYFCFTRNLFLNDKNNIAELKNYFENGLLIPIVYFLKRVFLFIDKYTGTEVTYIYDLIEKSLKLKIYISKYNYDFWGETDEHLSNIHDNQFQNLNKDKTKKESIINGCYFRENKYKNNTINALKKLKNKNYSRFDYTFLYQIAEKEFFGIVKNRKNLGVFELFSSKKKEPNIIIGDVDYFHSLILFLIQKEEKEIENYEKKTDVEKKLIRIYFLYKYHKSYFLSTIEELSIFNIFTDICVEFQRNYMSLLLSFLIESEQDNIIDIYNFKYYLLYILLLYKPSEIQSNIIELIGGLNTRDLGFIFPLCKKLFKKLILSIIDYFNPSDKIYFSHYFVTYNLITVFKFLCAQYNSFFQHHLVKSLSFYYKEAIPEKYMIKKIKKKKSNFSDIVVDINELYPGSFSSSGQNSKSTPSITSNYSMIDYITDDDNNYMSSDQIKIDFFDFFLCFLLKIFLITDNDEKRYIFLTKQNLYLYDLFHAILDMLIVIIQGNKLITIKNVYNKQNSNIFKVKNNCDSTSTSSSLNKQYYIETKETFQIFIDRTLSIIFGEKMENNILLDIKYKLLIFIMAILEEKNCNPEIQSFIIRKLNVDKIIDEIGKALKEYYLYLQENNNKTLQTQNIKIKEKSKNESFLDIFNRKATANFRDHRDVDDKINKTSDVISQILKKTKSGGENNGVDLVTFNILDNSNSPLCKSNTSNINNIYCKLANNKNYKAEETNSSNINFLSGKSKKFDMFNAISKNKNPLMIDNKNLALQKVGFSSYENKNKNIKKKAEKNIKDLYFNDKLCDFFHDKFYENNPNSSNEFIHNSLFEYANLLYRCIKKIAVQKQKKEAIKVIKRVEISLENYQKMNKSSFINLDQYIKENVYCNKLEVEQMNYALDKKKKLNKSTILRSNEELLNIDTKTKKEDKTKIKKEDNEDPYEKKFIEQFYIIKFFESITSTVEIRTKEGFQHIAIFTKVPEFKFLSDDSKKHFLRIANRQNEKTKKNDLLNNVDYFIREINHYKKNENFLGHFFSKIRFSYFQTFSYFYALVLNLFMLVTLEGDINISTSNTKDARRQKKDFDIITFKNETPDEWSRYYKFIIVCYIFINAFLIFLWIYFRFPLYYKLDKVKFSHSFRIKQKLKLIHKLYIIFFMTIVERNYILILLYELIFGLCSLMFESKVFVAFTLLPVIYLNETLSSLLFIVRKHSKELISLGLMACIVMYAFSNFAYFFYKDDYKQELDYYDDNVCNSLTFCFLTAVDYGLRARGGIGDSGIRISFLRQKLHYIGRVMIDDFFFLLIIVIMIDMLFGIIVQTFLNMRNKDQKQKMDEQTSCFICNVNVDALIRYHCHSLQTHKTVYHDMWNYVEYIISLKNRDTNFLNYIDTYVKNQIEKKYIGWMPTFNDFIKKYKCKGDDEESSDILILEETKNNKLRT